MSQDRLVRLTTISIEKDMAYQLKIKDLLKKNFKNKGQEGTVGSKKRTEKSQ